MEVARDVQPPPGLNSFIFIEFWSKSCEIMDMHPPPCPNSFIFIEFWSKSCEIMEFCPSLQGLVNPSGKSWICHRRLLSKITQGSHLDNNNIP